MKLAPGDVLETDAGPVAVTGCDRWPCTDIETGAVVSTIDDAGETRFFRLSGRDWIEVMPRG